MTTLSLTKTFTIKTCISCGVDWGMPDTLDAQRRRDGESYYCPNGHGAHYTETDSTRLTEARRQLEAARAAQVHLRDQRDGAERSASAYKGQVTRIKKRVGNGVCPCCKRSFTNLQRHMSGQHPDYADAPPTESGR